MPVHPITSPSHLSQILKTGRLPSKTPSKTSKTSSPLNDERPYRVICIKFTAVWCAPCNALQPILTTLSSSPAYIRTVLFLECNVDDLQGVAQVYGVTGMPTLVVLRTGKGQEVGRVQGVDINTLERLLKQAIKSSSSTNTVTGSGYVLGSGQKISSSSSSSSSSSNGLNVWNNENVGIAIAMVGVLVYYYLSKYYFN